MILPRLRPDLDVSRSPVEERPGLLLRDFFRYSEAVLIIPPLLVPGLPCFDGKRTELELEAELTRSSGSPEIASAAGHLIEALSTAAGKVADALDRLAVRETNTVLSKTGGLGG